MCFHQENKHINMTETLENANFCVELSAADLDAFEFDDNDLIQVLDLGLELVPDLRLSGGSGADRGLAMAGNHDDDQLIDNRPTLQVDTVEPSDADIVQPPSNADSRFASFSEEELAAMEMARLAPTTTKMTKWAVKLLREYLSVKGLPVEFETLPDDELSPILRRFYGEVRTRKGDIYSQSGMNSIRAAIQRHLISPPYNRTKSVIGGDEYQASNNVLKGVVRDNRRQGNDVSKHHQPIDPEDMAKLKSYFLQGLADGSAKVLQQKVFLDILTHFGRRGREGLRNMTKSTFQTRVSPTGEKYVTIVHNEEDKNHHGGHSEKEKDQRMYAQGQEILCPVQSFELYTEHLNRNTEAFWQYPKERSQVDPRSANQEWYKKAPIGVNSLGDVIKQLSKDAQLSQVYTNHCVRATVASALDQAGVQRDDIKLITGHQCAKSLDPYIGVPSDRKRQDLSTTLFKYGSSGPDKENVKPETTLSVVPPCDELSVKSPRHELSVKSPRHELSVKSPRHELSVKSPRHELSVKSPCDELSVKSPCDELSVKSPCDELSVVPPAPGPLSLPHSQTVTSSSKNVNVQSQHDMSSISSLLSSANFHGSTTININFCKQ